MRKFVKKNSSLLLAMGAGIGVLSTAYLSARAGYQTAHRLESEDPWMSNRERAKLVWRLYIPAAASAAATIVCITGVKHVDARKTLAAQTALAVSQRAYEGYREQVVEALGERKDQEFLAKSAERRVNQNSPSTIIAGSGKVLCCELYTGRYFESDMDTLNRALNELNAQLVRHDQATLDDFYYLIHLDPTSNSGETGWTSSRLVELEFSSILHDNRPVLVFEYNYVTTF